MENLTFVSANDSLVVIEVGLSGFEADVGIVDHMVLSLEPLPVDNNDTLLPSHHAFLDVEGNLKVNGCFLDVVVEVD